jgi:hypothetical protein
LGRDSRAKKAEAAQDIVDHLEILNLAFKFVDLPLLSARGTGPLAGVKLTSLLFVGTAAEG